MLKRMEYLHSGLFKPLSVLLTLAGFAVTPFVITGTTDAQPPTHLFDSMLPTQGFDIGVPYQFGLAKYAVAFFRNSFSSFRSAT